MTTVNVSYPADGHDRLACIEDNSFWFAHRNRCIAAAVHKFAGTPQLIDIGAGNGIVADYLQREGLEVAALEPFRAGANRCRQRGIRQVIECTLEDAPAHIGTWSNAGMFDVIEHQENDVEFLAKVRNVLAPKGLVFITVPAFPWLWSYEDKDAGHYRRYTRKTLRASLKSAGYSIVYMTSFFFALPLPIMLARTLPTALGRAGASTAAEHGTGLGALRRPLDTLLLWETSWIAKARPVPFGASLLAVARREET